ncbi:MAG: homocysteine S-methyltransferase family protein [Planctomycetes bacterium]|nr:homocysteine S-methyltransferase family protein [Planctomycetota bacterium]MCB9869032.1 homocysteine S-methyltransferase family protein [Planctomycetota bacterium]MCB9887992.1 homocysteine S-methyltransferase family protein [Planctomycetota bacterium]
MDITLLDGPLGTELLDRGVATPLPGWSAHALETAPQVLCAIHREYASAGAHVHTANTFRTQPLRFPDHWEALLQRAVTCARTALEGFDVRLAGSMAPVADCYRPEESPPDARVTHRAMARALRDAGVDLLLVETFPHLGELWAAVEEAVATGLPTWASATAGPNADLLSPEQLGQAARGAVERGATAVLVNCVPAARVADYLPHLAGLGVPFGAYANAGRAAPVMGFMPERIAPDRYADYAAQWVASGASIVGGCCGTGVAHITELARRFTSA